VIPAYKATFLRAALDSIAAQTCKDFRLYIGDYCSRKPKGSIDDAYSMSQDEPYRWMFSDEYSNAHHVVISHHIYDNVLPFSVSQQEALWRMHPPKGRKTILCVGKFRNDKERKFVLFFKKEIKDIISWYGSKFFTSFLTDIPTLDATSKEDENKTYATKHWSSGMIATKMLNCY
jgi:hypothetical protein